MREKRTGTVVGKTDLGPEHQRAGAFPDAGARHGRAAIREGFLERADLSICAARAFAVPSMMCFLSITTASLTQVEKGHDVAATPK